MAAQAGMSRGGGVPKPIGAVWMRMFYDSGVHLQFVPDIRGAEPVSVAPAMFYGKVFEQDTQYPQGNRQILSICLYMMRTSCIEKLRFYT